MDTKDKSEIIRAIDRVAANSGGGGGGSATAANQITGNNSLASIDGKTATLGQKNMAGSEPVVIASDQSAIPIAAIPTGTNSIGQVTANAGTNLNTSALALESGGNLAAINTKVSTATNQTNGSQKTQLVDGTGAVVGPVVVSAGNNLPIALGATNYVLSTVNTTVAQLVAGATFTGGIETTFNQQCYSVLLTSDQNGTLTLKQYIDAAGAFLAQSTVYNILAGVPFGRSNVVNGNYFNLTFQNNGGITTTTLNINTAYGTIPATTQLNNSPSAINEVNGVALSLGQNTMANSIPVTIASNQGNVPVIQQDVSASGNITTQNLNATGAGTANSFVGYTNLNASGSVSFQVTGVYTGALTPQFSNDGTNWITLIGTTIRNIGTSTYSATVASATTGAFALSMAGFQYFRLVALAAVTGTATVTMRSVSNVSIIELTNSTATIGNIGSISGAITPGTGGTNLGKARNAAIGATDTGISFLSLRNDTLATFGTTGNYNTPIADKYGSLITKDQTRHKITYSLAFTVALATTPTDCFQIIGSASKIVSINKINISGTQTTGGQATVTIAKRSTANTGGTSSASVMVPHDSADAAATAVGAIYTANPTTGTLVGNIRIFSLPLGAVTATTNNIVQLDFGERSKPIVLNGVAQALVINLGGATLTGGSLNIWMEFTEE